MAKRHSPSFPFGTHLSENAESSQDSGFVMVDGKHLKDCKPIPDTYKTLEEVIQALTEAGIINFGFIIGIDYTCSNRLQGEHTFGGYSLHAVSPDGILNPYQKVFCFMAETLDRLNGKDQIIAYGFGGKYVGFSHWMRQSDTFTSFEDVYNAYTTATPDVKLGGSTTMVPLIDEAIDIVIKTKKFHVLMIIADGQFRYEDETIRAIVKASKYPLSIVMIGVGDGPWEAMKTFDDRLPARKFDNFQFVDFHYVISGARNPQAAFALATLMEIPAQYKLIKELKLFDNI